MNPNEFGRRLGIGVRVAGRIAQQRAQQAGPTGGAAADGVRTSQRVAPIKNVQIKNLKQDTQHLTRAAGRGVGGFLRPFGRVGGILWLEVTGFFFGLFALFFGQDMWRSRLSYAAGPLHQRFLMAAGLTLLFGYLSVSAFWRARRR